MHLTGMRLRAYKDDSLAGWIIAAFCLMKEPRMIQRLTSLYVPGNNVVRVICTRPGQGSPASGP